jgi:hypothetical protein
MPVKHGNVAAPVADAAGALQFPAASVMVSRRTPSMLATSSCVITSSSVGRRSSVSSSQRQSCCSTEWCRLQAAVWAISVISAWV